MSRTTNNFKTAAEAKPEPELKPKIPGQRRLSRRLDDAPSEEGGMLWLITFTDIMGLMLTFFVLMFSMQSPDEKTFSQVTTALQNEFNKSYGRLLNAGPEDSIDISRIDYDRALDIRYLEAVMTAVVEQNEVLRTSKISLIPQGDHLILSLPDNLLFEVGKADIRDNSARTLFALGGSFSRIKNRIELVGNADPRPVEGAKSDFSSNWELSLARAVAVSAVLDKVGYTDPVTVRGSSSGRYQDLQGVVDENQRLDLSRRVDIDIMNHDGRRKKVVADVIVP